MLHLSPRTWYLFLRRTHRSRRKLFRELNNRRRRSWPQRLPRESLSRSPHLVSVEQCRPLHSPSAPIILAVARCTLPPARKLGPLGGSHPKECTQVVRALVCSVTGWLITCNSGREQQWRLCPRLCRSRRFAFLLVALRQINRAYPARIRRRRLPLLFRASLT